MVASVADMNRTFINNALERNWSMPQFTINSLGQVLDIELDSVPGWAKAIPLEVFLDVAVTAGASAVAPTLSQFAPWNFFKEVQVSLGGGPFQRVNPYFYYLNEIINHDGYYPGFSTLPAPAYVANTAWSTPTSVTATSSTTSDNYYQFQIMIPLQNQAGSTFGLIPMGNAATKVKLRLTVAPSFYQSGANADQYLNAMTGGTNITSVGIGSTKTSYVQPNIEFFTTPATRSDIPEPKIGYVKNIQERTTSFVGAGSLNPIKFTDPFKYLRLIHIVIDGTGAPNSSAVTNFELDLTPGYPQYNYNTPGAIAHYQNKTARTYNSYLPTGVFVFDLFTGSDPRNPNDTQVIDGSIFQTLQTQIAVAAATNVAAPAKIITYAEALSPVNF